MEGKMEKSVYFTREGQIFNFAHQLVEKEYVARKMLTQGKSLPEPDEYIIVFDPHRCEIVGALGIIEEQDRHLPFLESFSGVQLEPGAVEFVRFVIKRMIDIEEKIEIGRKLFEAAVNWCVLQSNIIQKKIECYIETQKYVIDFFNKATCKKEVFSPVSTAVYQPDSKIAQNSMGFIKDAGVYKVCILNAIGTDMRHHQSVA